MTGEELKRIIKKIIQGQYTEAELSQLSELLSGADNEQISLQLGKFNVNIGDGKDIHIGDRTYNQWDDEAVKSLIEVVEGNQKAIESFIEIIQQNNSKQTEQIHSGGGHL